MAVNMDTFSALSLAIAKAAGVTNPDELVAITYTHRVGELPYVVAEHHVWNAGTLEYDAELVEWTPKPITTDQENA